MHVRDLECFYHHHLAGVLLEHGSNFLQGKL